VVGIGSPGPVGAGVAAIVGVAAAGAGATVGPVKARSGAGTIARAKVNGNLGRVGSGGLVEGQEGIGQRSRGRVRGVDAGDALVQGRLLDVREDGREPAPGTTIVVIAPGIGALVARQFLESVVIAVSADDDLTQVVLALSPRGGLADLLHGRNEQ